MPLFAQNPWKMLTLWNKTYMYFCYYLTHIPKNEYDQEMPQSHTAGQPMVLWGRDIEHLQPHDIKNTIKVIVITLS